MNKHPLLQKGVKFTFSQHVFCTNHTQFTKHQKIKLNCNYKTLLFRILIEIYMIDHWDSLSRT